MCRALRTVFVCALVLAAAAGAALADSTPVGAIPPGPRSTITTTRGQLVAVALPHRAGGRVWRVARTANSRVVRETHEGDVGDSVVVVFSAVGKGNATIVFALTKGETAKAYESRTYVLKVA
jgi:hypothetical protein